MTRPVRAAGALLSTQAIEVVAQTLAGILAARALGPERNGDLVLALSVAGLLAVLLLFGTGEIAIRMHARAERDPLAIWGAQLVVLAGGTLVTASLGALLTLLGASSLEASLAVGIALVALAMNGLGSAMNAVVVARELAAQDAPGVLASRVLLVVVVASTASSGALAVLGAHVAAAAILVATRARLVHRALGSLTPRLDRAVLDELWRGGRTVGVASVFGSLAARSDVLVLRSISGADVTGLYGASYRVVNAIGAVSAALSLALFPSLVRASAVGDRRALWRQAFVACLLAAGVLVASHRAGALVVLLYGEAFRGAAPMLALLLVAAAVQTLTAFLHKALIATGREASLPWAQGAQAFVGLALLAWLVPARGGLGAAMATLGCELVVPLVHVLFHARRHLRELRAVAATVSRRATARLG